MCDGWRKAVLRTCPHKHPNVASRELHQLLVFGADEVIDGLGGSRWYNVIVFGVDGECWHVYIREVYRAAIERKLSFDELVVLVHIFNEAPVSIPCLSRAICHPLFHAQEVHEAIALLHSLGQRQILARFVHGFE